MIKHQTYIPTFQGSDGGVIESGMTIPQLADSMHFWIGWYSESTANYTIAVRGKGKIVVEQRTNYTYQTTEYWLTEGQIKNITIGYSKGKDVKLYGNVDYFQTIGSCKFASLDVSHNPAIEELNCSDNQLTSLDLSHNPVLKSLDCYDNQLTSLDVSNCPVLVVFDCYRNDLTSLDVSQNPALEQLICDANQLTSLDVSQNPALESLQCYDNQLTSLDVSNCPNLGCNERNLYAYYNPLWSNGNLDKIIASLPDRSDGDTAYFGIYCDEEGEEESAIYCLTESQIAALEAKGWEAENNY